MMGAGSKGRFQAMGFINGQMDDPMRVVIKNENNFRVIFS